LIHGCLASHVGGALCGKDLAKVEADGILNGAGRSKWNESNIKQNLTNEKYALSGIVV
jgi:hypothetical protein